MLRILLALAMTLASFASLAQEDAIATLEDGGKVLLIRHARAPGTGDPDNFVIDDCSTQRNLSEEGRRQAAALGDRLRTNGIEVTEVLSSRWCRALDTARLAFGDDAVTPFEPLDSFFGDRGRRDGQTEAARQRIAAFDGPGTLVMVTHQVNVTALTEIFPREGEAVVLEPTSEGFEVIGRVTFD
ncbi:histidine phosphatase family protein [Aquibium oceanicum]|uniref:Histidine phosphatase family protein n=1 Tax=Aquibium oceanicum TaxID=1670800 RepID=A0A1L3SU71_9HYPH|nr:histidine phosphatase family protein [Aquibium oceanicum]APH72938.1 histidine phosphatase family protein [Aquibium oceanicum]